jgi:oligo-1,6-glucosidase
MSNDGSKQANTSRAWWKEAVFYQIYPRSFKDSNGDGVGDLKGVIEKLDYLKDLGVNAVWMSPFYRSPMVDNGYDISDYEDIDPSFGTMAEFEEMLAGMHARGIKLMIDLVVNHTSSEHPWFFESRTSRENPKRDWYIWRDGKEGGMPPNNWASAFGGSAWTWDEQTGQYYLHLFSEGQPDLNWRNPEVKDAIFSMIRRWIERGIDGFRVDTGHLYLKNPEFPDALHESADAQSPVGFVFAREYVTHQPGLHELYQEMRREVLGEDVVFFGEMYDFDPHHALQYAAYERNEFNLLYQYPVVHARGDWTAVKRATREWYEAFRDKGWNSITFSNHDSARPTSIFGDEDNRELSAKLIATYLLTSPGTPFFLQGEELGMTNIHFGSIDEYNDPETRGLYKDLVDSGVGPQEALGRLAPWSRDNARTPMQWNSDEYAGFTSGTPWLPVNQNFRQVNAASQEKDLHSVLNFYRNLIVLRQKHSALVYGDFVPITPDDHELYAYLRQDAHEKFLIIVNTSPRTWSVGGALRESAEYAARDAPIIGTYADHGESDVFRPWEGRLYQIK